MALDVLKNKNLMIFGLLIVSMVSTCAVHAMEQEVPTKPVEHVKRQLVGLGALVKPVAQSSPRSIEVPVRNYCKKIIRALEKDSNGDDDGTGLNQLKHEILGFYGKIPYSGKAYKMKDYAETFYQALSFCMCSCLAGQDPNNVPIFLEKEEAKPIVMALESTNKIYVFQFRSIKTDTTNSSNVEPSKSSVCKYSVENPTNKPVVMIGVTFFINDVSGRAFLKIRTIEKQEGNECKLKTVPLDYTPDNFYTTMIDKNLFDCKKKDAFKEDLQKLYNMIPPKLRLPQEKFYQSILFCMITFFRSSYADVEKPTSRGRADIIMYGEKMNSVIEFKFNGTTLKAMDQIEDRDYPDYLNDDKKAIVLVAINVQNKNVSEKTISVAVDCKLRELKDVQFTPMKSKKSLLEKEDSSSSLGVSIDFSTDKKSDEQKTKSPEKISSVSKLGKKRNPKSSDDSSFEPTSNSTSESFSPDTSVTD